MIDASLALPALRASTAALLQGIESERWTDDDVRAPSLLPGWSRGHVLTHIARNADGISRALSGALRGEIVARYPDGRAGRDADIEAGARRSSVDLLTDVRESSERLDRVLAAVAEADGWHLPTEDRTTGEYAVARWREVEVHRLDLGGTYTADDWPPEFVSYLLPELAESIATRSETPLAVDVTADGSVTADLPGRTWSSDASASDAVVVSGPDWAVLAWLIGRPGAAASQLSAAPELKAWI
jgi:maleylpyruvate isomerase